MEYSLLGREFSNFRDILEENDITLCYDFKYYGKDLGIGLGIYYCLNKIYRNVKDKFPFEIDYSINIENDSALNQSLINFKETLEELHPQLVKEYKIAMRNKRYGENAEEKVRLKWLNRRLNRNLSVNNTKIKKVKI